jgi:ATP-dependent protease ClpP protease subunit
VSVGFVVDATDVTSRMRALARDGGLGGRAELIERNGLQIVTAVSLTYAPGCGTTWPGEIPKNELPADLTAMWQPVALALMGFGRRLMRLPADRPMGVGCARLELSGEIDTPVADRLVKAFVAARGQSVHIDINSKGGLIWPAFRICEAIERHDKRVTANIHEASSAAALVALAADVRRIRLGGTMMVHNPTYDDPPARMTPQAVGTTLADTKTSMVRHMAKRTGIFPGAFRGWMNKGATFGAAEALAAGLVHAVIDRSQWRPA